MKRIFTSLPHLATVLFLCFNLLCISASAQSFEFIDVKDTIAAPADEPNELGYYEGHVTLQRLSGTSNVSIVELQRDLASGHFYMYCTDEGCYMPIASPPYELKNLGVYESRGRETLKLLYYANDMPGEGRIKYRVTSLENPSDAKEITFVFKIGPAGVFSRTVLSAPDALSAPFPCPASGNAVVRYQAPAGVSTASVKLFDLMGRELSHYDLGQPSGELSLDLSALAEGVYFYALLADGQTVSTKRLIVSR